MLYAHRSRKLSEKLKPVFFRLESNKFCQANWFAQFALKRAHSILLLAALISLLCTIGLLLQYFSAQQRVYFFLIHGCKTTTELVVSLFLTQSGNVRPKTEAAASQRVNNTPQITQTTTVVAPTTFPLAPRQAFLDHDNCQPTNQPPHIFPSNLWRYYFQKRGGLPFYVPQLGRLVRICLFAATNVDISSEQTESAPSASDYNACFQEIDQEGFSLSRGQNQGNAVLLL